LASASRKTSPFGVTASVIRTASQGQGKGARWTISSGRPQGHASPRALHL